MCIRDSLHADEGARGTRGAEELPAGRIDPGAVIHIKEIDRNFENVGEARPGGVEHELHVAEHLARLRGDVVSAHDFAALVGGWYPGDEQKVSEAHRVAVMADRRGQTFDEKLLFHLLAAFAPGFASGQ